MLMFGAETATNMCAEQYAGDGSTKYEVVSMSMKCGGSTFEAKDIQAELNEKSAQGMKLVHMYQDSQMGGCGKKASLILVFQY